MLDLNVIYEGDCLEVMKIFPDKSIDMILCDLPYGVTARNKWDVIIPFEPLWKQYKRIIKSNGAIVLTSSEPFTSMLINSNLEMFRYDLIWEKSSPVGFLNANRMPLRSHENIVVFYSKLPLYNIQKTVGHARKVSTSAHGRNSKKTDNYGDYGRVSYDSTERYPTSILNFSTDKQKIALHPTQKPVALFEYLIKTYTNENDIVLDNCVGSGTTGIACQNLNRNFILIDKDPHWCDVSYQRLMENRDRLSNA